MTIAQQRSALAALDQGRPAIARLDISRDPEDIAADLIEGWQASETALRALIGSASLSGQPLIREVRQRELLTLDQAHALVEFNSAHDRAQRTEYRPTTADISAARTGFQQLEAALRQDRPRPATPPPAAADATATAAAPAAPPAAVSTRRRGFPLIALVAVLLVLAGIAWAIYYFAFAGSGGAFERGVAAYSARNMTAARNAFAEAIRDDPQDADPHIYLARIAREEGDANTAVRELQAAIQLEPNNYLAQREMGAHLLAQGSAQLNSGNVPAAMQSFTLARNFYVRAIELNPADTSSFGYLGCTLMRLGRPQDAMSWFNRAGQGPWSACAVMPQAPPQGLPSPVR